MKTRILKKIIAKKLISTNSEIYGITDVDLFGGGHGKTHKTILLDRIIEKGNTIDFVGYTIDDAKSTVINSSDVETLEGMTWKKFAQAYGLIKK